MSDARTRRWYAIGAISAAGLALVIVVLVSLFGNIVYYWSPTELVAHTDSQGMVRLGGMVVPGTLNWDRENKRATFAITDGQTQVPVRCTGNPPQMFREGIGVVVEGQMVDGVFHTDRVMVKHSNEYRAPGDGVPKDDIYKTLITDDK